MTEQDAYGLYADSWQGEIDPAAFSHPAKFSRGLIRYIYQHAIEQVYIQRGDRIIDPFGGVALGGLEAMLNDMHWTGVELEEKFVQLGQANIDLWQSKYGAWFELGTARIIQGDSRQLAAIVGGADGVIASPPYANGEKGHPSLGSVNKDEWGKDGRDIAARRGVNGEYGQTPGQLANFTEGDFSAAISSPPYADAVKTGEGPGARYDYTYHNGDNARKASNAAEYGRTEGNLGNMDSGGFEACVSSPPFEKQQQGGGIASAMQGKSNYPIASKMLSIGSRNQGYQTQGDTNGQLSNNQGESFWTAARAIVEQVYQVLKPGGVSIWVCGDFVRNRQRVYFGRQWLQLCEACGFKPLEWIRAWKSEHNGTQLGLFGEDKELRTDRVSFFRRLANEKNPEAAVLNEDVIIVRKPLLAHANGRAQEPL